MTINQQDDHIIWLILVFEESMGNLQKRKKKTKKRPIKEPSTESEESELISGTTRRQRKQRYLKVFERPSELAIEMPHLNPPKFLKPLADIECELGKRIVFEAQVKGLPTPEVSFYLNGIEVTHDGVNYSIESNDAGEYKLIIHKVSVLHDAEYACQARNIAGDAWSYGDLFVVPPGLSVLFRFVLVLKLS